MDIPESGAVFTLGKSFLSSDDHQSYFFIKNDPVKKLVAGNYQSAVICESGRLFVWGKNDFGQLGVQTSTTVSRPSCVKAFKSNGIKIKNIAFCEKFSICISSDNKVFLCGYKFLNNENDIEFDPKPLEIEEFKILSNEERFSYMDIKAGDSHFIVLTDTGKSYGYGSNNCQQISKNSDIQFFKNPKLIEIDSKIVRFSCHANKSVFLTDTNKIFIFDSKYSQPLKDNDFEDHIEQIYYSNTTNLYLIGENNCYLIDERNSELIFDKLKLLNKNKETDDVRITQISCGNKFLSYVTNGGQFFTNYEKKSKHGEFYELKKFINMKILKISTGWNHILVHAVPHTLFMEKIDEEDQTNVTRNVTLNEDKINRNKSDKDITKLTCLTTNENTSTVAANVNILNNESQQLIRTSINEEEETQIINNQNNDEPLVLSNDLNNNNKNEIVTENETKVQNNNTEIENSLFSSNNHFSNNDFLDSIAENKISAHTEHLDELDHNDINEILETDSETSDRESDSVCTVKIKPKERLNGTEIDYNSNNIDGVDHLIAIQNSSDHFIKDHANDSDAKSSVTTNMSPKSTKSVKSNKSKQSQKSVISQLSSKSISNYKSPTNSTKSTVSKQETKTPKSIKSGTSKISHKTINKKSSEETSSIDEPEDIQNDGMNQKKTSRTPSVESESNEIRFIDNGIDVTDDIKKDDDTKKDKKGIFKIKNSKIAPIDSLQPLIVGEELLGEKMNINQMKEIRNSKLETQMKLQEPFEPKLVALTVPPRIIKTPMPIKSQHFGSSNSNSDDEHDDYDDDCRTTASLTSEKNSKATNESSPSGNIKKNTNTKNSSKSFITSASSEIVSSKSDILTEDNQQEKTNKSKTFLNEMKNSSCKQLDKAGDCFEETCSCLNFKKKPSTNQLQHLNQMDNKEKSKICNIL